MAAFNAVDGHPGWVWEMGSVSMRDVARASVTSTWLMVHIRHLQSGIRMNIRFNPNAEGKTAVVNRIFSNKGGCELPHRIGDLYIFHHPDCACYECRPTSSKVPSAAELRTQFEAILRGGK